MEIIPRDTGADAVAAIRALADRYDLRQRAALSCHECLRSAAADGDLGGLALEDVQAVYERSALVFDHDILGRPFLETRFGLYVADPAAGRFRGLRPVGHYRLITRLDGTDEDDYLVLDPQPHADPAAAPDPAGL